VTTATRSDALRDIPTMADFVPGYEASSWIGVSAPRNTPVEITDKLNKEINAGLPAAARRHPFVPDESHRPAADVILDLLEWIGGGDARRQIGLRHETQRTR